MEKLLYVLGSAVCHQLPERSFFIAGHQLPLCMRCSGTYLGAIITFLFYLITGRVKRGAFPKMPIFLTILAFPLTMGLDVVTVNLGWRPPNSDIKLLTGIFAGFFIASFLVPAFHTGFSGKYQDKEFFTNFWFVLIAPMVFFVSYFLVHIQWLPLFYFTAIMQNISILLIFMTLNLFIFLTIFEKKYMYPIPIKNIIKSPLPIAFVLTIIELSSIYLLRYFIIPPEFMAM